MIQDAEIMGPGFFMFFQVPATTGGGSSNGDCSSGSYQIEYSIDGYEVVKIVNPACK